jgi:DNA-binding GntR family transcriptional regulator
MSENGRIERKSLAEEVAERLREDILGVVFGPGEKLVIGALAERYGVSHIPIREALRSLESEALVEYQRGSGNVVAQASLDDLRDLYDLRRLLEGHVLRAALPHYDAALLQQAEGCYEALIGVDPDHRDDAWWRRHEDFHWMFLQPGVTPWSERLLRLLWQSVERYQRLYALVFGDVSKANEEHHGILEAARAGDLDTLLDTWMQHLNEKEERVAAGFTRSVEEHRARASRPEAS